MARRNTAAYGASSRSEKPQLAPQSYPAPSAPSGAAPQFARPSYPAPSAPSSGAAPQFTTQSYPAPSAPSSGAAPQFARPSYPAPSAPSSGAAPQFTTQSYPAPSAPLSQGSSFAKPASVYSGAPMPPSYQASSAPSARSVASFDELLSNFSKALSEISTGTAPAKSSGDSSAESADSEQKREFEAGTVSSPDRTSGAASSYFDPAEFLKNTATKLDERREALKASQASMPQPVAANSGTGDSITLPVIPTATITSPASSVFSGGATGGSSFGVSAGGAGGSVTKKPPVMLGTQQPFKFPSLTPRASAVTEAPYTGADFAENINLIKANLEAKNETRTPLYQLVSRLESYIGVEENGSDLNNEGHQKAITLPEFSDVINKIKLISKAVQDENLRAIKLHSGQLSTDLNLPSFVDYMESLSLIARIQEDYKKVENFGFSKEKDGDEGNKVVERIEELGEDDFSYESFKKREKDAKSRTASKPVLDLQTLRNTSKDLKLRLDLAGIVKDVDKLSYGTDIDYVATIESEAAKAKGRTDARSYSELKEQLEAAKKFGQESYPGCVAETRRLADNLLRAESHEQLLELQGQVDKFKGFIEKAKTNAKAWKGVEAKFEKFIATGITMVKKSETKSKFHGLKKATLGVAENHRLPKDFVDSFNDQMFRATTPDMRTTLNKVASRSKITAATRDDDAASVVSVISDDGRGDKVNLDATTTAAGNGGAGARRHHVSARPGGSARGARAAQVAPGITRGGGRGGSPAVRDMARQASIPGTPHVEAADPTEV